MNTDTNRSECNLSDDIPMEAYAISRMESTYFNHYHMGFIPMWDSRVESAALSASCSSAQPSPHVGIAILAILIFISQLPYQSSLNTSSFDTTLDYVMKTWDVARQQRPKSKAPL